MRPHYKELMVHFPCQRQRSFARRCADLCRWGSKPISMLKTLHGSENPSDRLGLIGACDKPAFPERLSSRKGKMEVHKCATKQPRPGFCCCSSPSCPEATTWRPKAAFAACCQHGEIWPIIHVVAAITQTFQKKERGKKKKIFSFLFFLFFAVPFIKCVSSVVRKTAGGSSAIHHQLTFRLIFLLKLCV